MADKLAEAYVEVRAETDKLSGDMEAAKTQAVGEANKMSKAISKAVIAGTAAIVAASSATIAKTLQEFSDFDRGIREVFTLLPGISQQAMSEMSKQARELAVDMGVLPKDVIPALYQALSAGVPQDNVFEFLRLSQKAAQGGVTDLKTSVDTITSVVNAYGSEVLSATEASDLLFTTVRLGKCVVGSTRVLLSNGQYKRVDELQDGADVVSFDGRSFVRMSAEWVDQGTKPTVTLTTRSGRSITTTWNHPYLVDMDGRDANRSTQPPKWVRVKDMSVGDRIAVPTSLPFFGRKRVPEYEAQFLGLWLAEGACKSSSPKITTNSYVKEVCDIAKEYGVRAYNSERREGKAAQWLIANKGRGRTKINAAQQVLYRLGLHECSSATKHIPDEVFSWERDLLSVLLRWMFNGDGWLCDIRSQGRSGFSLGFCSKSERLVRDVSHLLLRFGIVGKVRHRKDAANAWCWETSRIGEVRRFVDHIGIDRPAANEVRKHIPQKKKQDFGCYEYDPVVSIVPGNQERVYDLCVDYLRNFVANDIIAHNTDFSQLGSSIFQVTPTAAALGVSFGDVTAALAAITAQGVPTAVATTQMRQLLIELSKEGGAAEVTFRRLAGMGFREFVAAGNSVADALRLLENEATSNNTTINNLFGSVEAGAAALALTGRNFGTFTGFIEEMGKASGATEAAYETMADSVAQKTKEFQAALSDLYITLGELAVPTMGVLTKHSKEFTNQMREDLPGLKTDAEQLAESFDKLVTSLEKLAGSVDGIGVVASSIEQLANNIENASKWLGVLSGDMSGFKSSNPLEIAKSYVDLLMPWQGGINDWLGGMIDSALSSSPAKTAVLKQRERERIANLPRGTIGATENVTDMVRAVIDASIDEALATIHDVPYQLQKKQMAQGGPASMFGGALDFATASVKPVGGLFAGVMGNVLNAVEKDIDKLSVKVAETGYIGFEEFGRQLQEQILQEDQQKRIAELQEQLVEQGKTSVDVARRNLDANMRVAKTLELVKLAK